MSSFFKSRFPSFRRHRQTQSWRHDPPQVSSTSQLTRITLKQANPRSRARWEEKQGKGYHGEGDQGGDRGTFCHLASPPIPFIPRLMVLPWRCVAESEEIQSLRIPLPRPQRQKKKVTDKGGLFFSKLMLQDGVAVGRVSRTTF